MAMSQTPCKQTDSQLGREVPVLIKVQNPRPFYAEPSFLSVILSVFAIGLSLYNAISANRKDSSARRQSINDEFWLRKVLFPTAIDPILTFFANTIRTLPKDRSDPSATKAAVDQFLEKFRTDYTEYSSRLLCVAILKPSLCSDLSTEFEKAEELVIDYCFANRDGHVPDLVDYVRTRASAITKLSELQIKLLQHIKTAQELIR